MYINFSILCELLSTKGPILFIVQMCYGIRLSVGLVELPFS